MSIFRLLLEEKLAIDNGQWEISKNNLHQIRQ